jgi:hypothetical protein
MLIVRGLADLNIKNVKLLTKIRYRLEELIEETNKNRVEEPTDELINPDTLVQILSYFIKLEFLQLTDYLQLQNLFFVYAQKYGIKNKETIFTMIAAHSKIMQQMIVETRQNNPKGDIAFKDLKTFK